MHVRTLVLALAASIPLASVPAHAQTFPTDDAVVERIWEEGIERSMTPVLAQALMDSIRPRLAGSPELAAAQAWLLAMYESWGVPARSEEYGTWRGWRQGTLHVDLVAPRSQTLEAELLAYSPGNDGPVEGDVVVPPAGLTEESAARWLETVAGKYVLTSPPEPMCRAPQELEKYARSETVARLDSLRQALRGDMSGRMRELGRSWRDRERTLEDAGAAGIVTSRWSGGWGVNKVFDAGTRRVPAIDISCEDYGMLFRMAEAGQGPRIRVHAVAEDLGEVPQFNVIAELRGRHRPEQIVVIGCHLDSWDVGTGAHDDGAGCAMAMGAMTVLRQLNLRPRRTIRLVLWTAEELNQ